MDANIDVHRYRAIKDQIHGKSTVRHLSTEEAATWAQHLESSRFGLQEAMDVLEPGLTAWTIDVKGFVHATYVCLPNAAAKWHRFKFERAVARVVALMESLGSIATTTTTTTHLSYIIIPTAAVRIWPAPGQSVDAAHINGAFTYRGPVHNGLVMVHRYEEYPKVMLHEALHHTRLDPMGGARTFSVGNIAIKNVLWSEAVVEAFADVYHTHFAAADGMGTKVKAEALLTQEREHAAHMAACVLQRIRSKGSWAETTNAFAYIVLRHLVMAKGYFGLAAVERDLKAWSDGLVIGKSTGATAGESMRLTLFGDC
jgi:hypothetical protein